MNPDLPGRLVRDLAHDMINPLSSLVGFLDLLLDPRSKDPLTHRQHRMLVAMDRALTHFLGMMRDVADLSKVEENAWKPALGSLDLKETARRAAGEYGVLAATRSISMTVETAPDTPPVRADPQMMERLFDVLLRAAGRLTPEKGAIALRLRPDGAGGAAGEVEHEGAVPSMETYEASFNASLQGPRPPEGYAALGLALARRIMRMHGGDVTASPRAGGGVVFSLRFPPAP